MNNAFHNTIAKDTQIKKFCTYGFLKNLKFFEPYLLIYLMQNNINLFQIGLLIAVREMIINLFEIPSGFVADYWGRKKELYLCFTFYIFSFIFFFFTDTFTLAALGMICFGLGEAFRSGTHKAMIYTYLDIKNWQAEKTYVYGRTRSFSLIGSSISSLLGITLILAVPTDRYIFLFSIVPYLLDLLLIMSYPEFLDTSDKKQDTSFKEMSMSILHSFHLNKFLRNLLLEEGIWSAVFSYLKDLIQPLLEVIIIGSGLSLITTLSADDNLKIILGLVYALLNLVASYFSKKAYLLKRNHTTIVCLTFMHGTFILLCGLLGAFSSYYLMVCIIYIFIYILHSMRKPIFLDEIDSHIHKSNRATVISASAQLKSLFLMVLAPTLGFIADYFGMGFVILGLCIILSITLPLLNIKH